VAPNDEARGTSSWGCRAAFVEAGRGSSGVTPLAVPLSPTLAVFSPTLAVFSPTLAVFSPTLAVFSPTLAPLVA